MNNVYVLFPAYSTETVKAVTKDFEEKFLKSTVTKIIENFFRVIIRSLKDG